MATGRNPIDSESTYATSERGHSALEVTHDHIIHARHMPLSFTDPAEYLDFARPIRSGAARFDGRTNNELKRDIYAAATALDRERALWELADRLGEESHPVIIDFMKVEPNRKSRAHALWLLQRTGGSTLADHLEAFANDDDPEVADWARLLTAEVTGTPRATVYTTIEVHEDRTFDQTLPLLIAGHALVNVPFLGRMSVTLSPLWFENILGRVMACTNQSTFMTDLVIEKELNDLHPDGTAHYEIFSFKGFSFPLSDRVNEHHYESLMMRPFYPSGTVEVGDSIKVPIPLSRIAGTGLGMVGCPDACGVTTTLIGSGPRAERTAAHGFVQSVRGRYFGWAAVNVGSVHTTGTIRPGAVQLSNPTHAIAGPMTNAMLFGTFRGKIADHTGNGHLDVNTIPCHGTVNGEHDLLCDGSAIEDPFLR